MIHVRKIHGAVGRKYTRQGPFQPADWVFKRMKGREPVDYEPIQ